MDRNNLRLNDRSTLHERVVSRLRDAIVKGEFQPGERLVQEELAAAMGVSRMPIREALRQLEKEGLVTLEAHKGAIVTPVAPEDIEEIYELRATLEAMAAEKSMQNLTHEDRQNLKQLVEAMEQAVLQGDVEQFVELNADFHKLLRKGCSWRRIQTFLDMLWNGFPPHTPNMLPGQMDRSLHEHKEMVAAIDSSNGEQLKEIMQRHILRTGEALKQHMQNQNARRAKTAKVQSGD